MLQEFIATLKECAAWFLTKKAAYVKIQGKEPSTDSKCTCGSEKAKSKFIWMEPQAM